MEFFVRAHIKNRDISRKDSKAEQNVKKQLKQMLSGYKKSDNKLIKESEDLQNEFEDSSSVSGVYDLELTNSSLDDDESMVLSPKNESDASLLGNKDVSIGDVPIPLSNKKNKDLLQESDKKHDSDDSNHSESEDTSEDSISEYNEDILSLTDDLDTELGEADPTLESIIDEASIESSDTESDGVFDPDGALASRILERLSESKGKPKRKKRKREETTLINKKNIKKQIETEGNEYKGPYRPKDDVDVEMEALESRMSSIKLPKKPFKMKHEGSTDEDINDSELLQNISSDISENLSPDVQSDDPFISVVATDIPDEGINDILGEYRYPTIKNLPYETQNEYFNNSEIFATEEANVSDFIEQDEVGSLIPELDNASIEDIDLPTDFDTSSHLPNEESTVFDETAQSEDIYERELSTDSVDPTFVNPVKVYYGKHSCVLVMKHPAQIYVHGKLKVKCLGGTVEIAGYILQDKVYELYAPYHNFVQYVRTIQNENAFYGLFGKLTATGLLVSDAEEIVTTIGEYDVVLNLLPLKSRKIDFVENNFNVTNLFNKPCKNVEACFRRVSEMLGCSLYLSKPWKSLQESASWKNVIHCGLAEEKSKGIICGGKGAGKSTFLRYYVNNLLAQSPVLVIDLDPGQAEFTVAGNLSATVVSEPLLGPNFTHLKAPEISLHIGMINTMDYPKRYVNAVEALITHCYTDETLQNMPWIVNTMGMTNAVGLKFITLIILKLKPTFLLQIDSKNQKKRYDFHLYPQTVKNLYFEDYQNDSLFKNVTEADVDYKFFLSHHTESAGRNNSSLAPRDERYLNFLAYFGELLDSQCTDFLGVVPYEVNLKELGIVSNVRLEREAASAVLNGKLVALCRGARVGVSKLADQPLRCYGCGLVRGIEADGKMYLLTPAAGRQLALVDTIVYADWVPELRGTEQTLPAGTKVPYRTASLYEQRQLMFPPKRRFNPLQLLKLSRNS